MGKVRRSGTQVLDQLPSPLNILIGGMLILTLLVTARAFLIPLAIAVLLWNLLDALIDWFARFHIRKAKVPRWLATLFSIGLVITAGWVVARILSTQVDAIAQEGPRYITRLEQIFAQAMAKIGSDAADQFLQMVQELDLTLALSGVLGSAGSLLINIGLVLIYVVFLMIERRNLPKKMAALFPNDARRREVLRIVLLISANLRRYLWIKTIMSLLTGGASYIVLRLVGVDFAETWALIIFLLNYIPNIGSALGVVFPSLLALVQFDTFFPVIIIAVGLGGAQMFIGNVLEPMFMGRTLNLSTFVIILSLTLWSAVWGIVGMFLSVPITVMLLIICAHVPRWRPLAILLSEDGDLNLEQERRRERQRNGWFRAFTQ